MNIKEYIESGILEAYVLDALTPAERADVAANIAQYPELADEVAAIEAAMLGVAEAGAQQPPAFMKEQIWNALPQPENNTTHSIPTQPKTIPLARPEGSREMRWQRAAVWLVLAGSMLVNIMLWFQRNESERAQAELAQKVTEMETSQRQMIAEVEDYRKERSMLADPGMQTVVMHSMKDDKEMAGMIYWSKDKGEAYLSLHRMPMPPSGMQYQLWVIQDGAPVDMGVIANDMVEKDGMMKVPKSVAAGQAFAISLEKEGGSQVPDMEQIYVMGKVS